jgi:6-pyruvoyl-tetrahydropterin synthase
MDFVGRKLVIATKHDKEKVIGPLIAEYLGAEWFINTDFDTDLLGTFSGEVERKDDALITLKNKCLLAMEASNCDLGIASEGSFGPHPTLFFGHADDELLIFIDKKNDLEIYSRELSTETNFGGAVIRNLTEAEEFASKHGFPEHALIVKNRQENFDYIQKGVNNSSDLSHFVEECLSKYDSVYLETDMRAMYNPTRMKVIESAAQKLMKKINSKCPECKTHGFSVTEVKSGLRCEWCSSPTDSILYHLLTCQKCSFSEKEFYPNGKKFEDPMYCSFCNP